VTGAFLVIGLKYGRVRADDPAAKDRTYDLVQEFIKRFKAKHGTARCNDLLGCDIGSAEGQKTIERDKLHETRCEPLIRDAVAILEAIL
jgi:C_GCAxxG_C_C family probable redox protein